MAIFDPNWVFADFFATLFDTTVQKGGYLEPQDDFAEAIGPEGLPYDRLAKRVELTDFRQEERSSKHKRGRPKGTRKLANVHSIWLHQTAALLGGPERFLSVPAHRGIPLDASAVLLHPIAAYMYHGHHANRWSIGYEIACRAAGIEGKARTFWRSSKEKSAGKVYADLVHEASDEQIDTTRALVEYDLEEVGRQGGEIRYIGSHRQSHKSRVSDPGSKLWRAVGEWAIRTHGLKRSPEYGSGRPNPTAWTGVGREPYSLDVKGF